jgi:hypothetical protein
LVATHSLWIVLSRDHTAISGYPEFWAHVRPTLQWRYLIFPGHPDLETFLRWVAIAALIGAVLGIYSRFSCLIGGLLLYHLAPIEVLQDGNSPYALGLTLAPTSLLILAFTRSSDALTIWPRKKKEVRTQPASDYGWPRRLIWLLVSQIYLFSAYAKFLRVGWEWGSAEHMRSLLLRFAYFRHESLVFTPLSMWIVEQPLLLSVMGVGTLIFESVFVVAVFSRIARRILVPMGFSFHIAIAVTMGLHVGETWLLILFVNYEWIGARVKRSWARLS